MNNNNPAAGGASPGRILPIELAPMSSSGAPSGLNAPSAPGAPAPPAAAVSGSGAMDSTSEQNLGASLNSASANKSAAPSGTPSTAITSSSGNAVIPATPSNVEPTSHAVLEFLKKMGMGSAYLELKTRLEEGEKKDGDETKTGDAAKGATGESKPDASSSLSQPKKPGDSSTDVKETSSDALKQQLEHDDAVERNQRTVLTKATGGGFGYDRDAAAPIVQWGVPDNTAILRQEADKTPKPREDGQDPTAAASTALNLKNSLGVEEARSYLDAFTALQIWVLTLPDDDDPLGNSPSSRVQPAIKNPIAMAQALIRKHQQQQKEEAAKEEAKARQDDKDAMDTTGDEIGDKVSPAFSPSEISLSSLVKKMANSTTSAQNRPSFSSSRVPPSAKAELLAVTFALLVHTYCELLEVRMESTAHVLRDAFQPIYDPLYGKEFRDLFNCTTTEDMMKLNTYNSQHMEALANLKTILMQIASLQLKKDELSHARINDAATQNAAKAKLQEFDQRIHLLQQKYNEVSQVASVAFDRMYNLPFLRRARAVRWQLTLSTTTYGMLCSFLNTTSMYPSLLAMSTLLQSKCELHIEQRDPLPFTPACVLDDNASSAQRRRRISGGNVSSTISEQDLVNWAAPVPRNKQMQLLNKDSLPFPKFHLNEEYDNALEASRDKRSVEFNRAVLVNGFRRLEALERKRDYQVMASPSPMTFIGYATGEGKNNSASEDDKSNPPANIAPVVGNPLAPSILLSTLCANSTSPVLTKHDTSLTHSTTTSNAKTTSMASGSGGNISTTAAAPNVDVSAIWEESGVGLCCAKICPPDGRRVAVGCDDAGIRIWNLMDGMSPDGSLGEPVQVLLGHKNGFPIFDLSWNRDGRHLLSAGGDCSIRLWDTMAQGPYGQVAKPSSSSVNTTSTSSKKSGSGVMSSNLSSMSAVNVTNAAAKQMLDDASSTLRRANANTDMTVPGLRQETNPYVSGAALAVYHGHAAPIWSVAFAPSGYYFATAGADSTARLWTTDRPSEVRLFTGHTAHSVNSVVFHPNCNYILTGGEDKTSRLWDVQTGQCVRLLNGCSSGINVVEVSPSGQYAAGADMAGFVHLWDLGTGKKITEFRSKSSEENPNTYYSKSMIHSLSFSACGTALAAGGDDCCVRIWDIQQATRPMANSALPNPVVVTPSKVFATRRTMILDLNYTKRNLLLSAGKFVTAL
jgi:WD40 repeat protein